MEYFNFDHHMQYGGSVSRTEYGLSQLRIAEILDNTAMLETVVMRLALELPFEAEPWGFGEGLMRLAEYE